MVYIVSISSSIIYSSYNLPEEKQCPSNLSSPCSSLGHASFQQTRTKIPQKDHKGSNSTSENICMMRYIQYYSMDFIQRTSWW